MSYREKQKIDQLPIEYIFSVHSEEKKQGTTASNIIDFDIAIYDRENILEEYRKRLSHVNTKKNKWKGMSDAIKGQGISNTYPTLKETLNRMRREKGIDTQKTLCIMANMDESRLSKEINGHRPIKRDTLFALALAMRLSREETEVLFHVADKDLFSTYSLTRQDIEREQLLKEFIGNSKCTVQDINLKLKDKGMKILGNFDDEIDDFSVAM